MYGQSRNITSLLELGGVKAIEQALSHVFRDRDALVSGIEPSASMLRDDELVILGKYVVPVLFPILNSQSTLRTRPGQRVASRGATADR